jgi:hypothetical protein
MMQRMTCRKRILVAPLFIWFSLALTAPGNSQSLLALQSTPTLKVFVYSFPELSHSVIQGAESEAERMLRPVRIDLNWIDCTSRLLSASCRSHQAPTDLILRFLPEALPETSARALGISGSSADYATAFIFYERILALRTHTHLLPAMLGRVLAHEITHLLLPQKDHSEFGLMRGQWSADDLRFTSAVCLGLSARSVEFMQREALRRMVLQAVPSKVTWRRTDRINN